MLKGHPRIIGGSGVWFEKYAFYFQTRYTFKLVTLYKKKVPIYLKFVFT